MIYITSDLHFGHDREFLWGKRGFISIEEHDAVMIENWNCVITPDDEVYILGDLMLKNDEHGLECISKLNGRKHIILGNHDTNTRIELYKKSGLFCDEPKYADIMKRGKYNFYLSHYPTLTSNYDTHKPLKNRVLNLCGHSHTANPFEEFEKGIMSYHVDPEAHNCTPVSIEKIIEDFKNYWENNE